MPVALHWGWHGAACVVVVYDITRRETFKAVEKWVKAVEDNCGEDVLIALVGIQNASKGPRRS